MMDPVNMLIGILGKEDLKAIMNFTGTQTFLFASFPLTCFDQSCAIALFNSSLSDSSTHENRRQDAK